MSKEKTFQKMAGAVAAGRTKLTALALTAATAAPMIVSADNSTMTSKINDANGVSNVVLAVADVVVNIFPFVGIFFILAGVFKLIMAYRDNRPEDQAAAAKDIVIGAIFLAFKIFAWNPIKAVIF